MMLGAGVLLYSRSTVRKASKKKKKKKKDKTKNETSVQTWIDKEE